MKGEEFVGALPANVIWSEQSDAFFFKWKESDKGIKPFFEYSLELNAITETDPMDEMLRIPSVGDYNEDRKLKVYARSGDIFLHDPSTNQTLRITQTNQREDNPQFVMNEEFIVYEKESNLYLWSMESGTTRQISDFKKGKEDKDKMDEMQKWLERDQLAMFDVLTERKLKSDNRKERQKLLNSDKPKTIYTGEKSVSSLSLSPDGKYIYYQLYEDAKSENTDNLDYVTESGYAKLLKAREKVGSSQDNEELWVYQIEKDTMLQFDANDIPGIYDKPEYLKNYEPKALETPYDKPRNILIHGPDFSEDGQAIVEIRSQDNKDRWFMLCDPANGSWEMLERQHDDAWIGGPGITGWNMSPGNKGWMPDGEHYWFHSEESGYSHLYSVNISSGKKKALTKGKFEIHEAFLSRDESHFYIVSNEADPGERHLYKMDLDGKEKIQITKTEGRHDVSISPDEKWIVSRYSSFNQPWELYLMENTPGAEMTRLTESTTTDFNSYTWRKPELLYFKASDGEQVRARLYQPEENSKNGAAVIFVHGAGYLQNAHKWWSNYYREYMFHNLLADLGYTVMDIDYRGSKGYGRDWRTGIYRHMGGKDLSDQVDGAGYLVREYGIDPDRIGIYGGSYGGFITLMALFNNAETFACGAALRSVTDWAHYNHPYTSNILNTPATDSIAYRKSSPIYHAEGLEDPLVMLHGVVDTNVQFQDVVRLSQRLIELGKTNWDLAVFPVEGHGFQEASSWADEYRRILELFEENLRD
jgi:dipeptidyl aminopeptidase/acylaminoacyl peptidase